MCIEVSNSSTLSPPTHKISYYAAVPIGDRINSYTPTVRLYIRQSRASDFLEIGKP